MRARGQAGDTEAGGPVGGGSSRGWPRIPEATSFPSGPRLVPGALRRGREVSGTSDRKGQPRERGYQIPRRVAGYPRDGTQIPEGWLLPALSLSLLSPGQLDVAAMRDPLASSPPAAPHSLTADRGSSPHPPTLAALGTLPPSLPFLCPQAVPGCSLSRSGALLGPPWHGWHMGSLDNAPPAGGVAWGGPSDRPRRAPEPAPHSWGL